MKKSLLIVTLCSTLAVASTAFSQIEKNIEVVSEWLHVSITGDLAEASSLLSDSITIHEVTNSTELTREQWIKDLAETRKERGPCTIHQIELFGQRDKVVAIYSLRTSTEPMSAIQIFRVANNKIAEAWPFRFVRGALWSWDPDITGDTDVKSNAEAFAPWYEDVYATVNWKRVPELTGPRFIRHERTEFEMTQEEYSQRLRKLFERVGPRKFDYEVVAGRDKVAVIAKSPEGVNFVQAWRIRDGKLVESWWASRPK